MANKEKQNLEWKSVWKDVYLEWICGFANNQGGKLYIGIDDKGTILGIEHAKIFLKAYRVKLEMLWV